MNLEKLILDTLTNLGEVDFGAVIKWVLVMLAVFWVFVLIWIWFDISERTRNIFFKIPVVLLVAIFNVFGLLLYFLVRPKKTLEEKFWSEHERRYLNFETSELGDCPRCRYQLAPGFVACPSCGEFVKVKCPQCENFIDKRWRFCGFCGFKNAPVQNVTQSAPQPAQQNNPPQPRPATSSNTEKPKDIAQSKPLPVAKGSFITKFSESTTGFLKKVGSAVKRPEKKNSDANKGVSKPEDQAKKTISDSSNNKEANKASTNASSHTDKKHEHQAPKVVTNNNKK